jgi:flagellar biogenesis protein FliO
MVGVIILAVFVFKYSTGVKVRSSEKTGSLRVIDTLSLSPRKTLYVVEARGEKFLIAGDAERTTLISKLESITTPAVRMSADNIPQYREDYSDKSCTGKHSVQTNTYTSVMKNLAEKISAM